jgi:hypothetical protein
MTDFTRSLAVIGASCFIAAPGFAEIASYRLTVDNTWSESTHPGAFPGNAHFSWLGGASHSAAIGFWSPGALASTGIVEMAETGATFLLVAEVEAAIAAGTASGVLSWQHWFCPDGTTHPSCGPLVVEFDVDDAFPLVRLATMLGPSPDWFVGVSGLELHDGTDWVDSVIVDLRPYDGGTQEQNLFELGGPQTAPPEVVSLITAASDQRIGPGSLGTFRFQRIGVRLIPALGPVATWILGAALLAAGAARLRRAPRALGVR